MDRNSLVLEISSDEEVEWNDDVRSWLKELLGDENECGEKPVVKKVKLESNLVDLDDVDDDDDDGDCVVLDEDPCKDVRSDKCSGNVDDDVVVVSEKGQVACRDYPHSRHLCIKFPFNGTPKQSHCSQCYCYVCDSLAPCVFWGNGSASSDHCHATDKDEFWKLERKNAKNGGKAVQAASQLSQPLPVDLYTPPPLMVQLQNQIPQPGPVRANHTSANFQTPHIISQYRNNILASRNKLHPDLTSQLMHRVQQTAVTRVHRPVFKRTGPVRAVAGVNRNQSRPYRGDLGNLIRQRCLGSLQPNAVNASVPYPPQSQTYTYSTVNQPQPQLSYHPNPNFQSHVNSTPIPRTPIYRSPVVPPLSSQPQPQPAPSQQTYMMPVQPSYHVPSKTQVDSPLAPVSDLITSQGNQSQGPIVDSCIKDKGLGLPTGQDSATLEGAGSGNLADYQFDWMFENQPIEPGFTDYSSDSAFIDTGPIFNF